MQDFPFLVDAWQFASNKPTQLTTPAAKGDTTPVWYHCDRNYPELADWLKAEEVDPCLVESLLAQDTRPRFEQLDENTFLLIIRAVNLNEGAQPDDMLSLRILYTPEWMISIRKYPSKAVSSIREQLQQGKGPNSLEGLLVSLLEGVGARIEAFLEPSEQFIDAIDTEHGRLSEAQISQVSVMQRRLLRLSRFLKPQAYALEAFQQKEHHRFADFQVRLANVLDVTLRINESIDFYLAQIAVLSDRIQQQTAERMNRNTYILSVIAGIFLPLGFLTGLFGINIAGMPGTDYPLAFAYFCAVLGVIGVVEYLLFRRLKFV